MPFQNPRHWGVSEPSFSHLLFSVIYYHCQRDIHSHVPTLFCSNKGIDSFAYARSKRLTSIRSPANISSQKDTAKKINPKASGIFQTCQICSEYADQLGSCDWSEYVQLTMLNLSRMAGKGTLLATRRSKTAEGQSISAALPLIFRVECCMTAGGKKKAVSRTEECR